MAFELPPSKTNDTVNGLFFNPLHDLFAAVSHRRHCPKLDDLSWLLMGIWRVLDESGSGRGFLQEHGLRFQSLPTVRNYFQSLRSERRADLVTELNAILLESTRDQLTDRLADIPELDAYEVFAVDGHWHTGRYANVHPQHELATTYVARSDGQRISQRTRYARAQTAQAKGASAGSDSRQTGSHRL